MLSSNKMTDDQRINMIRMSNPPTDVALCLQNLKKKKKVFYRCGENAVACVYSENSVWQQPEK